MKGRSSLSSLRTAITICNHRAGTKEALINAEAGIKPYLDQRGIVNSWWRFPKQPIEAPFLDQTVNVPDVVIASGGDGTLASTVNAMWSGWGADRSPPVLVVPSGMQNAISLSLGLASPQLALNALVTRRIRQLPTWELNVTVPPSNKPMNLPSWEQTASPSTPLEAPEHFGWVVPEETTSPTTFRRIVLGTISVGAVGDVMDAARGLYEMSQEFEALPAVKRRVFWGSVYTAAMHKLLPPMSVTAMTSETGGSSASTRLPGDQYRAVVASSLPLQASRFSVTPRVSVWQPKLGLLTVSEEATRLRMAHLLCKEAPSGNILQEDGVASHDGVEDVTLSFDQPTTVFVDGERIVLPRGSTLKLRPSRDTLSVLTV